ncbi:MAG: SH3 domain-containing protein [Acidobacteriota bacterium]|nr:SH3 domain-containing protein [Acidobacteriota bacterium]
MRRLLAATAAAVFAAGLWSCSSAPPPPPPPAPEPAPEPAAEAAAAETAWVVTAKTANVRDSASTKAGTVAKLKKGDRLTGYEEKDGWLRVKLKDTRAGWIRKDLLKKDDGCLPDRREVLLTPPMLHMSEGSGASGTASAKGKVVVEADIDENGKVRSVRVVTNETGSPARAETAKSEVQGVTFQPPVKKCRVTGFTYVYTRTF